MQEPLLEQAEKKEGQKMIKSEDLQVLAQLIHAMEDSINKLEEYYNKKDLEKFNRAKKAVIDFQQKINRIVGGK